MRDDFTLRVKESLAKRVAYKCSNPDCRVSTIGPRQYSSDGTVNIGVAAHISAASAGGPRYDEEMLASDRRSVSNGIWLCQNCAHLIDSDVDAYPVDLLHEWKSKAEQEALRSISRRSSNSSELFVCSSSRNYPPFALGFEDDSVPEDFFGIISYAIPFTGDEIWVDRAPIQIDVQNASDYPISISNIICKTKQGPLVNSAVQFIAQGVVSCIELLSYVDKNPTQFVELNRDAGHAVDVCSNFFLSKRIEVPPKSTESIRLSLVAENRSIECDISLEIIEKGVRKIIDIGDYSHIRIAPAKRVPDCGKQWSIHSDGRARGNGFIQNNLFDIHEP